MGKLSSGRVKRTPQNEITSDRYEFLALPQAEPNLGDPLVGPSSIGTNPIPIGSYYQLAAIGEKVGERYWTTPVGIGTTLGIITVYDNGFLPNNAFSRIHGLNFVGAGVTVEVPSIDFIEDVGIATIRIAVNDILNQGDVGQVLFNTPSGVVGGALDFYYHPDTNNVGIGSTLPSEKLDLLGNLLVTGDITANTITAKNGFVGSVVSISTTPPTSPYTGTLWYNEDPLVGRAFVYYDDGSSSQWVDVSPSGTGINIINVSGSNEAIELYWTRNNLTLGIHTSSNVGIGTINPTQKLDVVGNVKASGSITATSFVGNGSGLTNLPTSNNGLSIRDNNSIIGISTILNFADNLDVVFSSGIATIRLSENITGIASDSQKLNGQPASYYLNYNNLTNTPATYWELNDDAIYSNFNVGIGTSNPIEKLDVLGNVNVNGNVVANNFVGDGSGLFGIVATGSGIEIRYNDNPIGTAATVNFSGNLEVQFSSGIATVTSVDPSERITITKQTGTLGIGQTANITFTDGLPKYSLLKASVSSGAWVTIYTDQTSRTSDSTRSIDVDPLPGSGVISELITSGTGITTQRFTPGVVGYNDDTPISNNIYAKVYNNSGISSNITVTLTITK